MDGIPYVFTAEEGGPSVFVYAVLGALPPDETARTARRRRGARAA